MSRFRDLIGVAWTGLSARKMRTLLIMLGPIVGVAAMVGPVGLPERPKGDLKTKPPRVKAVTTVTGAAATTNLSQVIALPVQGGSEYYQAFPVPVRAADVALPS